MTCPVMSFASNTGTRWPHFIDPRKTATSDGTHDSTGTVGVVGTPSDETDEKEEPDREGVEGWFAYTDAACCRWT